MATIISKTSILRCPNFLKVFLPLVPLGSAWRVVGPQLPRQNAAAFGSPERSFFGRPAASRGKGSRGCEEQRGPWPRTRIWGENLLSQFSVDIFSLFDTFCTLCFSLPLCFLLPLVCRQDIFY